MQAGWLDKRVTIQVKSSTRDAVGQEVDDWEAGSFERWASIEPLRGREFLEARQQHNDVTTRIRLRFDRSLKAETMRVRWIDEAGGEHIFEIMSVIHQRENKRQSELMCREVITHG